MEQTRISTSTKPAHETHGARGAGKAHGATAGKEAADGAQGGGFSALLAALGDGLADAGQEALGALTGVQDGTALGAATGLGTAALGQDPSALSMLTAGLLPGGAMAGRLASTLAGSGLAGIEQVAADSMVGQTMAMDNAADAAGRALPAGAHAGPRGAAGRFQAPSGAGAAAMAGTDAAGGPGAAHGKGDKTRSVPGAGELAAAATTASTTDRRDVAPQPGAARQEGMANLPAALSAMVTALADGAGGGDGRASARGGNGGSESGSAAQGLASAAGPSETTAPDFALDGGAIADPSQVGAEEQIAEQVAYWVHQKTQSAELTLDRDGQPVEVQVSVTGNEAHVTFRSDQAQTRELLDSSVAQLRDLLQREGLALSGVTVGTSGGGAQRDGARDHQDGARQGRVQAAVAAGSGATPARPSGTADRALSVFA